MSEAQPAGPATTPIQHVDWSQVPMESVNPLLDRQIVTSERMMLARIFLKRGCVVPLHSHDNEQITHVQSGALHFTVGSRELTVHAGEFLCIPPNVPHTAVALEDTVDIDIFTPPREDWLAKTDQYLRG